MQHLIRVALTGLVSVSVLSTIYLYSYPFFHGCAFPTEHFSARRIWQPHVDAPFRLLALGDPQLEGDSSLLELNDGYFPSLRTLWVDILSSHSAYNASAVIKHHFVEIFGSDIRRIIKSYQKRLDLLGNDFYLAHIYRTVHLFTKPTHVTVLGDLLGSQWVSDEEFERRGQRYWQRIFRNGEKVDDEITGGIHIGTLGESKGWETRIINIAGNHDVGYAGDLTQERIERFERLFGKVNWETRFNLRREVGNSSDNEVVLPELRIVVLNSLNLDTPALSEELQADTYNFMNGIIHASHAVEDRSTFTIILTHIPLHKEPGICTDSPYFAFHGDEHGGGVKEQNHQSYNAGKGILEGILGMSGNPEAPGRGLGRNGIILTGHDHEGCDVYHFISGDADKPPTWKAKKWSDSISHQNEATPGIREITVRSMMGDFGGNAGLLSAWFDDDTGEWRTEYSTCYLGTQHIWWAIHILDFVTIGSCLAFGTFLFGKQYANLDSESKRSPRRLGRNGSKATLVPEIPKAVSTSVRARRRKP